MGIPFKPLIPMIQEQRPPGFPSQKEKELEAEVRTLMGLLKVRGNHSSQRTIFLFKQGNDKFSQEVQRLKNQLKVEKNEHNDQEDKDIREIKRLKDK
jgi:MinD-like ATPase involved in chromosome partitioning or flagellar assembly